MDLFRLQLNGWRLVFDSYLEEGRAGEDDQVPGFIVVILVSGNISDSWARVTVVRAVVLRFHGRVRRAGGSSA